MIDYDKLKVAHALNKKLPQLMIRINLYQYGDAFYSLYDLNESEQLDCDNLDDLIYHLEKMVADLKPEPRYKEGDHVWLIRSDNIPIDVHIEAVDRSSNEKYLIAREWWREEQLYPSRAELIESQIEYWKSQRTDEQKYYDGFKHCNEISTEKLSDEERGILSRVPYESSCMHEDDGMYHSVQPSKTKCKKCGGFYA